MFHYHFKYGGFYAFATNLTSLIYLVERLDLTRFSFLSFFIFHIYIISKIFINFKLFLQIMLLIIGLLITSQDILLHHGR